MNNQSAQTMPELPHTNLLHMYGADFINVYTADQMHQYARDYAAALSQTAGVVDGWRTEIESILSDDRAGGPPTDDDGSCVECGRWTPRYHPEVHQHKGGCKAVMGWGRRLNWRERLTAMLAAAPAASVVDTSTNEAWAERAKAKIVAMDAAASVSERATVSLDLNNLPAEWPWDEGSPCLAPRPVGMVYPAVPTPRAFGYLDKSGVEWAAYDTGQMEDYGRRAFADGANTVLRAIEQALTQQRGALEPIAWAATDYQADGPITQYTSDRYAAEYYESIGLDVRPLYATTPQPGAEALRELARRILDWQPLTSINKADRLYQILMDAGLPFESVTDELESLLGRGGK